MPSPQQAARRFAPRALWVALALAGTAQAQTSPYSVSISQGFAHQSNLFGTAGNAGPVPDKYAITSLQGGLNLKLSRQRVYANAVIRANRYEDVTALNNNSSGLNLGWDWQTINNLSGELRHAANRSLASYTTPGAPQIGQQKNIETTQQSSASVRYEVASRLALTAGLQRRAAKYSALAYSTGEFTQTESSVGVRYGLPSLLVLGLGLRNGTTDRPRQGDVADRNDIDFTVDWAASGLSTVNARLSYGKEDHSLASAPSTKGTTGSLGWNYRPSDKTGFTLSVSRDTGTSASFAQYAGNAAPLALFTDNLTTSLAGSFDYAATAKIRLNAALRQAKSQVNGSSGATDETSRMASLGANYAYSRSISFNCGISHEKRKVVDVSNRNVNCAGQLTLQ